MLYSTDSVKSQIEESRVICLGRAWKMLCFLHFDMYHFKVLLKCSHLKMQILFQSVRGDSEVLHC